MDFFREHRRRHQNHKSTKTNVIVAQYIGTGNLLGQISQGRYIWEAGLFLLFNIGRYIYALMVMVEFNNIIRLCILTFISLDSLNLQ